MVRIWDPFVRLSHWIVALGFFVAYLTEDDLLTVHVWAGYVVGGLVVLRLIWGFIGPRHARFTDFVYGPRSVLSYLLDLVLFRAKRYLGHSPAGGSMAPSLLRPVLECLQSHISLERAVVNADPPSSDDFEVLLARNAEEASFYLHGRPDIRAAVVDLEHCNGCELCFDDCPFDAITVQARTDGRRFANT